MVSLQRVLIGLIIHAGQQVYLSSIEVGDLLGRPCPMGQANRAITASAMCSITRLRFRLIISFFQFSVAPVGSLGRQVQVLSMGRRCQIRSHG